ncbi:MAG TPA: methyltransferase [Vicinamibacterales bacterium]|jgi:protein-S-isoprenylcysteine O-methyltransferase Ste14
MKRAALAGPAALHRDHTFGPAGVVLPHPDARPRDLSELISKVIIVTLFSGMAVRLADDYMATGRITGLLLLASESLVVVLTMFRRSAEAVDRTWQARLLTAFSMFGPPLVKPASLSAMAPDTFTAFVSAIGLAIVVTGKVSLGRSFGLTPANRGIVSSGLYRFLRHPIYLGYLITHIGFVIANTVRWNLIILAAADIALLLRAVREEKTLALDHSYEEYMQRVRWRILPGVF